MGQELASHGYLVFIPDFIDGTCTYTEMGERNTNEPSARSFNSFETAVPLLEHVTDEKAKQEVQLEWFEKIQRRMREMDELLNDIHVKGFAKNVLKLGRLPVIETKKLIMMGHQMGGATAIMMGDKDKRVSAVVALDPWLEGVRSILQPHWQLTQSLQKKPMCIVNSQQNFKASTLC